MRAESARAIAWRHRAHALVCDVVEPWRYGTAARCTAHPGFWDYNSLRLEGPDPGLSASELAAEADRLQGDLRHRRMEVEHEDAGRRLRPGFEALGWTAARLVWMALSEPPAGRDFEEVPVELTRALRLDWARSEGLELSERDFLRQASAEEDVARRRGVRAFIVADDEGDSKRLYERLGFRPVWIHHEFTRRPTA